MQAAVPAPINFTVAVGGTSPALNPTMFSRSWNHRNVKVKQNVLKTNEVNTR